LIEPEAERIFRSRKSVTFWQADLQASIYASWIRKLRLAGLGDGAVPGGKPPKRGAFPIAVIAHEKVIRPQWARKRPSPFRIRCRKAVISLVGAGFAIEARNGFAGEGWEGGEEECGDGKAEDCGQRPLSHTDNHLLILAPAGLCIHASAATGFARFHSSSAFPLKNASR